jgi:hypothetical protein
LHGNHSGYVLCWNFQFPVVDGVRELAGATELHAL